jgi:hypothetical protein
MLVTAPLQLIMMYFSSQINRELRTEASYIFQKLRVMVMVPSRGTTLTM